MDCLFCKIAAKQIPSKVVHDDNDVFAFEDINPQAPVHVLIIPKKHVATLNDLEKDDCEALSRVYMAAKKIALDRGVADSGFRVVANCNADAGQTVFHLHFHLLGGRKFGWPPG